MAKGIDLGKSLSDMITVEPMSSDKKHYPDLCITSDNKEIAQMPDQGDATIKYRVVSRTHREEKNGNGKEYSCSLRLEVLSIDPPPVNNKKKDSDGGARKAMDNYFKDK